MRPATVVLIDDHPPLRDGLRMILERTGEFRVAAEAGTVDDGISAIRRTDPQCAVVDLGLPDGDGIDLIRIIKRERPDVRVLILTMFADRNIAGSAMEAGADGYLLKESSSRELVPALNAVLRGEVVMDPRLEIGRTSETRSADTEGDRDVVAPLTEREMEVFRLLAVGRTSKDIGAILRISPKTVDNHRAHILLKTGCASTADLVRLAIRTGVIQP